MRKAVIAITLAALAALVPVTGALADSSNGSAGLTVACGNSTVAGHNPNCGF